MITAFAVLAVLVLGFIAGYLTRSANSLVKGVKNALFYIRKRIVTYWYVIVFAVTTWYVWANFDKCLQMTFTAEFNGTHLLFIFWLVLIVFPFFESFEGFGISLKKQKNQDIIDDAAAEYHENVPDAPSSQEGGNS